MQASHPSVVETGDIDAFLAQCMAAPEGRAVARVDLVLNAEAVWKRIEYHGISLALSEQTRGLHDWPAALREKVMDEARHQVFWEETHREILVPLLDRFAAKDIPVLIMKGTALAYSMYGNPAMRRRGDTDLLVERGKLREARAVLSGAGLERVGDSHFGQESWVGDTGCGFTHIIDLHWDVVGSPALRKLIRSEECFARSIALPRLSARARTLDPVLQLIRCSINRELHFEHGYFAGDEKIFEGERLIWLLDTHLLASSLTQAQWEELGRLVSERGLGAVVGASLRRAGSVFDTELDGPALAALEVDGQRNPLAEYVAETDSLARLRLELRAMEAPVEMLELLQVRLFPSPSRIAEKYPRLGAWPMPLRYCFHLAYSGFRRIAGSRS